MQYIFSLLCLFNIFFFSKESNLLHNLRLLDESSKGLTNVICYWYDTENSKVYDLQDLKSNKIS